MALDYQANCRKIQEGNELMDTTQKTTLKVTPEHLERLVEFIRRSGRPQTLEALTRRYIELLRDEASHR